MTHGLRVASATALAAGLLGCAFGPGTVAREMLLPAGAERHVIDPDRQRFLMAAPIAAAICTDPPGSVPADDPACRAEGARVEAVPIRLDYSFRFEPGGCMARQAAAGGRN